jgi:hypothetical protein
LFTGKRGDCLLIETNREEGIIKSHLFVLIVEMEAYTRNTIIVNIQSINSEKYDHTTRLKPGDHEFIIHDSFVNYRLARIISMDELEVKIRIGLAVVKKPFTNDILNRICEGICKSDFTPMEVVEMYQNSLFSGLHK